MTSRFDDRQICFASGKKVSPPMSQRRTCACCGQRIVKGCFVEGGPVGDDCADIIWRFDLDRKVNSVSAAEFSDKRRATGWILKPAVVAFLSHREAGL